jgi:AraC-like DNA-binding protein
MDAHSIEDATLIDLGIVRRKDRHAAWRGAAPALSPSLSVNFASLTPPVGSLKCVPLGEGTLWAIRSSPASVEYRPPPEGGDTDNISLLMQSEGSVMIRQSMVETSLSKGDICFIDERQDFDMLSTDVSGLILLKFPRQSLLARLPQIAEQQAPVIGQSYPGSHILRSFILSLFRSARDLPLNRRHSLLLATTQILSAVLGSLDLGAKRSERRLRDALAFINSHFHLADVQAEQVACAQGISRRRLDQILSEETGLSISAHIWKRRLESAAVDLRDFSRPARSITDIAFDNGFQDSAHFCRAFARRFGCSPSRWRRSA